jgi:1-acyl-sn-glycerol-3-phosphate acyltransferase
MPGDDRLLLRELTDELMFEIRALTGQEYVDEYATRTPDALPAQPVAVVGETGHQRHAERAATHAGAVGAAR